MLILTSLLEHFIVFSCLSVFRRLFYCVLISVRLPSITRRTPLFMTLLVPNLLLRYRPTSYPTCTWPHEYGIYVSIGITWNWENMNTIYLDGINFSFCLFGHIYSWSVRCSYPNRFQFFLLINIGWSDRIISYWRRSQFSKPGWNRLTGQDWRGYWVYPQLH